MIRLGVWIVEQTLNSAWLAWLELPPLEENVRLSLDMGLIQAQTLYKGVHLLVASTALVIIEFVRHVSRDQH